MIELLKKAFRALLRLLDINAEKGLLYYISGSDVLPSPLSHEEEQRWVKELDAGSDEAKAKLIEHNLRLVVYISKKFENTGIDIEDLISVGTIGLIKAVNSFNSEKNIKLATYASRCKRTKS